MPLNRSERIIFNIGWDYLLVFLLIANSAIPFFYLYIEFKVINLIIVCIIFFLRNKSVEKFILLYILVFTAISIGQFYTFHLFLYKDFLSVIIRILIAYLTIRTVSLRFFPTFRNLIYVFAIISLFFYLPSILVPGFSDFITSKISPLFNPPFEDILKQKFNNQIIIYNFADIQSFRNAGPFWEAATFGGFLIIAIIINTTMTRNLFEKKNLVMIIALITTLSTTSYIAFFLLIMIYFITIQKKTNSFIIVLPSLAIFLLLFVELGFMKNKIVSQIGETDKYYQEGAVGNRFVSALVDINDFLKYPLFGKGRGNVNVSIYSRFERHRSNGLVYYLANFGIVFFLFYFSNLYLSFFRFCLLYGHTRTLSYALFFLLILIGFSEDYYNHPFFYALTMLHLTIPSKLLKYLELKRINQYFNLLPNKPYSK